MYSNANFSFPAMKSSTQCNHPCQVDITTAKVLGLIMMKINGVGEVDKYGIFFSHQT